MRLGAAPMTTQDGRYGMGRRFVVVVCVALAALALCGCEGLDTSVTVNATVRVYVDGISAENAGNTRVAAAVGPPGGGISQTKSCPSGGSAVSVSGTFVLQEGGSLQAVGTMIRQYTDHTWEYNPETGREEKEEYEYTAEVEGGTASETATLSYDDALANSSGELGGMTYTWIQSFRLSGGESSWGRDRMNQTATLRDKGEGWVENL